jgi:hypothetical protein
MLRKFFESAADIYQNAGNNAGELEALRGLRQLDQAEKRGDLVDIPLDHPVVETLHKIVEIKARGQIETKKRGRKRQGEKDDRQSPTLAQPDLPTESDSQ